LVVSVVVLAVMFLVGAGGAVGAHRAGVVVRLPAAPLLGPTYVATLGGPGHAQVYPGGMDVDKNGTVYVADTGNDQVKAYLRNGSVRWVQGRRGPPVLGSFDNPRDMVNPDIYLADLWGYKIDRVSQSNQFNFAYDATFGGVAPPTGLFNEPSGVIVDGSHTYVADSVNQRMQRFDTPTGAFQLEWGERGWGDNLLGFNWPRDLTLSASTGTVWVADTKNGRLVEFDADGNATGRTFGALGSSVGYFNRIFGVVSYGSSLIVAGSANNRVQRWDMSPPTPTLIWTAVAGNPQALALDGATVVVTDTRNNRLLRLDASTGAQIGGYLGVGSLHAPDGLAVDAAGNIWVADRGFNRLAELSATGTFLQAYGTFGSAHGQFNQPAHLAMLGNLLYVCDVWNDRVEIFGLGP
jgi:DNA-binding beta-propeller fold protein YncE